ncbi:helix-turn-helix domain-containing protein [Streptomyces sp. WAC01280]|uniref:helix-turn-helix domain-containing protein n=1 Tax=Streptomyces sp. WAC01280 TaxID=2487424 RepID=UPI00163C4207|nr:helix-turn-helix transcriptional regulator [Streptomyces sp. WAC01280]
MTEQQYGRRAVEVGVTGKTVAANLARLRKARGLSTRQMAAELERMGRPVSASGVTRMEKGDRHVTSDDLAALAILFGVSPSALLLPLDDNPASTVEITGAGARPADKAWDWVDGKRPLFVRWEHESEDIGDFHRLSRPPRRRRHEQLEYIREVMQEEVADGPSVD